jgi:hypothetical protein
MRIDKSMVKMFIFVVFLFLTQLLVTKNVEGKLFFMFPSLLYNLSTMFYQILVTLFYYIFSITAIFKCESEDDCPRSTEDMLPYKWKCLNHTCRFVLFFIEE